MGDSVLSPAERIRLDQLIGRALINDDLCRALLFQESRRQVLDAHTNEFSRETLTVLKSISDKDRIEELAHEIYTQLYTGNGNGTH